MRFRASLGQHASAGDAIGVTMDTAGKAVLFSSLTVLSTAVGDADRPQYDAAVSGGGDPRVGRPRAGDGPDAAAGGASATGIRHRSSWTARPASGRPRPSLGRVLVQAPLRGVRSADDGGKVIEALRDSLPGDAKVGGVVAEVEDFRRAVAHSTPIALGVMLLLAFVLLLVAFQAPIVAPIGTATSALSTGAAFGVTGLIFQDGHLAGVVGFTSQGFLDFWVPLLFFAMIFAIYMDYTVFLLSTTREHWERTGDARTAMVESMARSGRVIIAAAGVMIGVFFTFAVADSLAAKEFGAVMGVAVILDAFLVRLLVLPVALRLLGARAWWQPAWLVRVLPRVSFGHAATAAAASSSDVGISWPCPHDATDDQGAIRP